MMDKIIKIKNEINDSITKNNIKKNIKISKTLNSFIFKMSDNMYCFSNNNYKKLNILCDDIYFNDIFHLIIQNNIITIIDSNLFIKKYYLFFQITNIHVKNKYIILNGNNQNILINQNNSFFFDNYEVVELDQYTLFFNYDNSYIIDEFGNIEKKQPINSKIRLFYNIIKNVGNIDNFIDLIV